MERLDAAFRDESLGITDAVLIVQGGQIRYERYGDELDHQSRFPSWSKAKSITQALVGLAVAEGRLDVHAPADVPAWKDDARSAITLDQLLRMSSGLKFVEDYVPGSVSDVIEMLFGAGKADVAAYAIAQPLAHEPDSHWSYASGTTNVVCDILQRTLGLKGEAFEAHMRAALFEPLGMASPIPKFDAAGTFIGSSYCFCSARDFARFGLLYLRGGVWEGRQMLPADWVDYARTPTAVPATEELGYGAHWWLGLGGEGSFSANGYEGQYTLLVPDLDLIVVRHGRTPLEAKDALAGWMRGVVEDLRRS
ncbi:MAG: class C beta-lactamase-related serine hydrolase [Caulobacteraceae bacterium]|nr:MAG: class C beta-lactamase-related serine hydrolase [Caulobacteraceae bacterium]